MLSVRVFMCFICVYVLGRLTFVYEYVNTIEVNVNTILPTVRNIEVIE